MTKWNHFDWDICCYYYHSSWEREREKKATLHLYKLTSSSSFYQLVSWTEDFADWRSGGGNGGGGGNIDGLVSIFNCDLKQHDTQNQDYQVSSRNDWKMICYYWEYRCAASFHSIVGIRIDDTVNRS